MAKLAGKIFWIHILPSVCRRLNVCKAVLAAALGPLACPRYCPNLILKQYKINISLLKMVEIQVMPKIDRKGGGQ